MSGTFDDETVHEWLAQVAESAYMSLHYDSPALGSLGRAEIDGGGYQRVKIEFSVPASRTIWSLTDARFTGLKANTLTHFGIWDQSLNGRLKAFGRLPSEQVIVNGGGISFPSGKIALSIA